jgi:polyhydroxyalkanoate synthase
MRGLALVAILALGCSRGPLDELPARAIKHRARTSDGWELALVQYKPEGERTGRPVLLCHGISANDRNMDLDERHSLARWLARQGREAWTVSLRGGGLSDAVDELKGRKPGFDFDTLWREDVTAAIAFVRERTGGEPIDYVGHSMGGMLVYAYLSQGGGGLNAVATLGSPTRLDWGGTLESFAASWGPTFLSKETILPLAAAAQLAPDFDPESPTNPLQLLLYNPKNTLPDTWKKLTTLGTADLSGGLALQLLRMVTDGGFNSADETIDYRKDMARIRVPVLVVAGKLDRVGTPVAVKDGYRALGGPKGWLLISEANGAEAEYGHMDLLLGERAPEEVWVKVLDFLNRHAQRP